MEIYSHGEAGERKDAMSTSDMLALVVDNSASLLVDPILLTSMILNLLISTLVFLAPLVTAEEFRVVIYTPKFSHYSAVSLTSNWSIDIRKKADFEAVESDYTAKIKGAKHVITSMLYWDRGKVPEPRWFWIAATEPEDPNAWKQGFLQVSSLGFMKLIRAVYRKFRP